MVIEAARQAARARPGYQPQPSRHPRSLEHEDPQLLTGHL